MLLDERRDKVYAKDYDEGFKFPVREVDRVSNTPKRLLYKVVYDGELKDNVGCVIGRRKLWELVSD